MFAELEVKLLIGVNSIVHIWSIFYYRQIVRQVVVGVLSRTKTIIHVVNGWFMVILTLLMLAALVYGCSTVGNVSQNPNVVLMLP